MNPEGDEFEFPKEDIAKLTTAVTNTAGQLRQLKILVLIYAVASLLVSVGSTVYFASFFGAGRI